MYRLDVKTEFSAAHRLVEYPGACSRIHGHNYTVRAAITAPDIDENGMVMDLMEFKTVLDGCVQQFDHRVINDVKPFDRLNPTSEQLAKYIYDYLAERLPVHVESVMVAEIDAFQVTYQPS